MPRHSHGVTEENTRIVGVTPTLEPGIYRIQQKRQHSGAEAILLEYS
jgi:hypothetical protein